MAPARPAPFLGARRRALLVFGLVSVVCMSAPGAAQTVLATPVLATPIHQAASEPADPDETSAPPVAGPVSPDPATSIPSRGSSLIPHDLSPYGMFLHADLVVRSVMVGLAFAALVTWTILLAKGLELLGANGRAKRGLSDLAGAATLSEAAAAFEDRRTPVARLVDAALAETERSDGFAPDGIKDRAAALLARIEGRAGRAMARGTGILATIGSTAPFVGLFGTVWGIMNAFIGISRTNTTNLAVVAPGIAEALLATAFGLVAAIPAVIIYNVFARAITGYRAILADASTEVMRLLSRDLDRDSRPPARSAPIRAAE